MLNGVTLKSKYTTGIIYLSDLKDAVPILPNVCEIINEGPQKWFKNIKIIPQS